MEWVKKQYNAYYNAYMPWIEDKYLAWFGENKTSYTAKGMYEAYSYCSFLSSVSLFLISTLPALSSFRSIWLILYS